MRRILGVVVRLSWARLYSALGLKELDYSHLSEGSANRMRREQLRGSIDQMRVLLAGNTFFAPTLAYQAWGKGIDGLIIAWTVVMLLFSWALFFSWSRTYKADGNAKVMRRFVLETYVNSGLWGVGMVLFYPFVQGDEKTILVTIMAGTLALGTVGFSRTPAAAFAFLGVQTAFSVGATFVTGLFSGSATDFTIALLSLTAGGGIFNVVLERAKQSMQAFNDHEALAEKSDVIDLLLKDYEEQATEWMWQTDASGLCLRAPQQVLDMIGAGQECQKTKRLFDIVGSQATTESCDELRKLNDAMHAQAEFHDVTLPIRDVGTGEMRWIMVRGRPQFENDRFIGYRGICADATVTEKAKREVEYFATHDVLTGLNNRNTIKERLADLDRRSDKVAAFLVDLDGFKQVNDTYGHAAGDELLRIVADRLREAAAEYDLVARLGGDEFLLLHRYDWANGVPSLLETGQVLVEILSEPYQIDELELSLSASVGLARLPADARSGEDLLIKADLALYAAKNRGRNQCMAFAPSMQEGMQKRMIVISRLKRAIKLGEIVPFYQPQYSLENDRLVGFEALARWSDAELGIVGPDIFIPIAEETGLIEELGEALLRRSCKEAMDWPVVPGEAVAPVVSVNLSPLQFSRGNVTDMIRRVLSDTGLGAERLEVEITEGVLISDAEKVADTLLELTALGVNIALDDFGTGYSSLGYLQTLPLNRLKIDRSFVIGLSDDASQQIANTIIQLGKSLNLSVIAEGVETLEQRNILARLGCHDVQGYLYSPPVPVEKAVGLILETQVLQKRSQAREA